MAIIKHNNQSISSVTAFPSAIVTGKPTLISTATASSSASISFTSGIDSTYDIYKFEFVNCHPATNDVEFRFQTSTNGGSSYGVTATTTYFVAYHNEAGNDTALTYESGRDLAQSTSYQPINDRIGNDNDQSMSGELYLFSASSTTYVKHYISKTNAYQAPDFNKNAFSGGYFNTTSSINAINFIFSSGNIDAGTIKMYGI